MNRHPAESMKPNYPVYVCYHDNCLDGFGAALAAWMRFDAAAEYIPVEHGKLPSDYFDTTEQLAGSFIYILDFSWPMDQLKTLASVAAQVIVLDHHKTFKDNIIGKPVPDNLNWVFDDSKSGAVITWEYFFPNKQVPILLQHIQDRDLWQWKLNGTKEVCAALANEKVTERSFRYWEFLLVAYEDNEYDYREVTEAQFYAGKAILAAQELLIEECMKGAKMSVDSNIVLCNAPGSIASDLGNRLAEKYQCRAIIFSYDGRSGKFKCSIRSIGNNPSADCTSIARIYGGGGHYNAAGCSMTTAEMMEWLA